MTKVLIVYDSWTGHTEKAAELIGEGAERTGVAVELKSVEETKAVDIKSSEGIAVGCPTHFFSASRKMKSFLGREEISGALREKTGAVFTTYLLMPMGVNWLLDKMKEYGVKGLWFASSRGEPENQEAEDFRRLGESLAESARE